MVLPTLQITAFDSAKVCYRRSDLLLMLNMLLILAADVTADAGTNSAADAVLILLRPLRELLLSTIHIPVDDYDAYFWFGACCSFLL